VLNVGYRPTVASAAPELRVEAHLLETDAPLYGQPLEITFVQRLRDEIRFPSLSALRDQIARDITAARTYFAWTPAP
jgi:riboflavin kinase/FMN adenylyltransferase